jgi:cell wall-associated NlpC family hydrolase
MPSEGELRAAVLAEALTWVGTPFMNGASIKGSGVDCAMLIKAVFVTVGVLPPLEVESYPSDWHLHRDEERYLEWAHQLAVEIETPQPADVAIWRFGRCYSHAGILLDADHVIHAWRRGGGVQVDALRMGALSFHGSQPRPVKYFDLFARQQGAAA